MFKNRITIDNIPAILWGETSSKLFIAIHGNQSSKSDDSIFILAEAVIPLGYQVLSFDLPEHGDRKVEPTLCKVQNCVADLKTVLEFAGTQAAEISLFACSIGTYFSLLAYKDANLRQCLFLSPVVDMNRIINNMMMWFHITEERLEKEREISTSIGQVLYWDYYQYVKLHPITKWNKRTSILYGKNDELCEYDVVSSFAKSFNCSLEIAENAEHYFHTEEQLELYKNWLRKHVIEK